MCHYHHLTLVEREKIMFFHAQDNSVSAIAKKLGRNKATISREIRRNTKNEFTMKTYPLQLKKAQKSPIYVYGIKFMWLHPRVWLLPVSSPVFSV